MTEIAATLQQAERIADTLKALAHPIRLRIIAILCEGDQNVNTLAERLSVKQAIVSQHLRILRMRSLVEVARRNGFAYYRLAGQKLRELVRSMTSALEKEEERP
jgi:ArsR family transcriptional regulator